MLSITTDCAADTGDPSPSLRAIAAAGFTHIHWCHHWNTDFLYSTWEIDQIKAWLDECGLQLLDLHGSAGQSDQHKPLFSGTVDWPRLAAILARSAYTKCASMEVVMRNSGIDDERAFLATACCRTCLPWSGAPG